MRYSFHATNGREMILDRAGRRLRADGDLARQAEAIARCLMAEVLVPSSWAGWQVCVHNEHGEQVEIVPFPGTQTCRATQLLPAPSRAAVRPRLVASRAAPC